MKKLKGSILIEVLIALTVSVGVLSVLYSALGQAALYRGKAAQLFAATHYAINTVNHACAYNGAVFAQAGDLPAHTIVTVKKQGTTIDYCVQVFFSGINKQETIEVHKKIDDKQKKRLYFT